MGISRGKKRERIGLSLISESGLYGRALVSIEGDNDRTMSPPRYIIM
jgi:hypothetical protein